MELTGAAAIVTGGASGLGEATARRLASAGARVVILDKNVERGEKVAAELGTNVVYPNRAGVADEFASLALELITNDYMNGETVRHDGAIRMPPR